MTDARSLSTFSGYNSLEEPAEASLIAEFAVYLAGKMPILQLRIRPLVPIMPDVPRTREKSVSLN